MERKLKEEALKGISDDEDDAASKKDGDDKSGADEDKSKQEEDKTKYYDDEGKEINIDQEGDLPGLVLH